MNQTTETPTDTAVVLTPRRGRSATAGMAVVGAVAAAGLSGHSLGGGSKATVVLPLVVAAGLLLVYLAATRFTVFVLAVLAVRASLDVAKLSSPGDGATSLRLLDPATILSVVFLLAALLWLAGQSFQQRRPPPSALGRALLAFAVACLLSVPAADKLGVALVEFARIASAVAMFVVVERLCAEPRRVRAVLGAVFVSAVIPIGLTVFGFVSGSARIEEKGDFTRVVGTFNQSNEFGRYLMLVIIMGVAMLPLFDGRARRLLIVLLGGAAACLIPTYTRTALVGTVIGLLVIGLLVSRRAVVGLLVAVVCALAFWPGLAGRFTELSGSSESASESSVTWRVDYWGDVVDLARNDPLTGIGLAQTQYHTPEGQPPHNDFIRAAVETGVLGLVAYLGMLATLIATGWRAVRAGRHDPLARRVAVGYLGCAAAFVAMSVVANLFSNVVTLWYFFAFAGAASATLVAAPPATAQADLEAS